MRWLRTRPFRPQAPALTRALRPPGNLVNGLRAGAPGGGAAKADQAAGADAATRAARSVFAGMAGLVAALMAGPAQAAGYAREGLCDGWPRAVVPTAEGLCAAIIAGPEQGLRMPRRMVEVAPGRYWLIDLGGWDPNRGRLLELTLDDGSASGPGRAPAVVAGQGAGPSGSGKAPAAPGGAASGPNFAQVGAVPGPDTATPRPQARLRAAGLRRASIRVLADKLDRPHGLAIGPDGKAYIGEAGIVWRTTIGPVLQRETVLGGLPADGAHPLKELVFAPGGRLFVNIGSASDACRNDSQRHPHPCPELQGAKPRGAVYEARLGGPAFKVQQFTPYATGLRNSLALAWEPIAGVLWQGENSVDYAESRLPPEELNRLKPGGWYGWPYCVGSREPARAYAGRGIDCQASEAPHHLWPAHAAPLQMLVVPRAGPAPWASQMLVAWHGYRANGRRLVAFDLDAKGEPAASPRLLLGGDAPSQPVPAPTGIAVDSAGRLFVLDDRNRTVLMLVR